MRKLSRRGFLKLLLIVVAMVTFYMLLIAEGPNETIDSQNGLSSNLFHIEIKATNSNKIDKQVIKQIYKNYTNVYLSNISDYTRVYNLHHTFHICDRVVRPEASDIVWRKGVYQQFKFFVPGYGDFDTFILDHYFDDRFFSTYNQRYLRAPVTILGPGPLDPIEKHRDTLKWAWAMTKAEFKIMLWYQGFDNPIASKCEHKGAGGLARNVSGSFYFQQIMHCPIPEIDMLPSHVSLAYDTCHKAQTYIKITYPRAARSAVNRDIGVCTASLYGSLNKTIIPYFVNWMETLRHFGVIEVSMNNASLRFEDEDIARAFQYYVDSKQLILTHYPVVHNSWNHKHDEFAAESINKITTGDCFYRNLKRYWYTLIIDMDEIPVPRGHNTYAEYLQYYLDMHPNLTDAHCLIIRTAFFYTYLEPSKPEVASHLPVLRYTNRFRTEPIEDSHDLVGISKSFHNPRNCVASGHHLCRQRQEHNMKLKRETMPEDGILVHHYRSSCKYKDACKKFQNEVIDDDTLPRRFAKEITNRVEKVLSDIGFLFGT